MTSGLRSLLVAVTIAAVVAAATAPTASAGVCGLVGWVSGVAGKACDAVSNGDRLITAGKKFATGHLGGAVKTVLGAGGSKAGAAIKFAAIGAWVAVGARVALQETAKVIGATTSPQLTSTWFSSRYWRMSAISAVLTMPFLFAAAVQALIRGDLMLLARAALGYLPLSMLAVSIAAPVTMLLLAVSDNLAAVVSAGAGDPGGSFLSSIAHDFGVATVIASAPFLAFLIGLLTAAGAIVLWIEMLMREAAIYVVVLMLPLAFAALVWPARRIWAIRTVELLVALILSKFVIVAVLALGGAAVGRLGADGIGRMMAGLVLVALGAFAPWALLRVLPLAELASTAAGHLTGDLGRLGKAHNVADEAANRGANWAGSVVSGMRRQAAETAAATSAGEGGATAELAKLTDAGADDRLSRNGAGPAAGGGPPSGSGPVNGSEPVNGGGPATGKEPENRDGHDCGAGSPVERSPGMDLIWQAPDETWRPLKLGTDGGWPPPPPWPPEAGEDQP